MSKCSCAHIMPQTSMATVSLEDENSGWCCSMRCISTVCGTVLMLSTRIMIIVSHTQSLRMVAVPLVSLFLNLRQPTLSLRWIQTAVAAFGSQISMCGVCTIRRQSAAAPTRTNGYARPGRKTGTRGSRSWAKDEANRTEWNSSPSSYGEKQKWCKH